MSYSFVNIRICTMVVFWAFATTLQAQLVKKAINDYTNGRYEAAEKKFEKLNNRKIWVAGSSVYLESIRSRKNKSLYEYSESYQKYCQLIRDIESAKGRKKRKYKKRGITVNLARQFQNNIYSAAFGIVKEDRSIFKVDSLGDYFVCDRRAQNKVSGDSTEQPGPKIERKDKEYKDLRDSIVNESVRTQDYDIATRIIERHLGQVSIANMEHAWRIQEDIWDFFRNDYDLCQMDKFQKEHPRTTYARDCWFDEVRDIMCAQNVDSALLFHDQNHYTIFEYEIISAIFKWSDGKLAKLTMQQREHYDDIVLLAKLDEQILGCSTNFDSTAFIDRVIYYCHKYQPRYSAFTLLKEATDYLLKDVQNIEGARKLVNTFLPEFKDTASCRDTDFMEFQTQKQSWLRRYQRYLTSPLDSLAKHPMMAWNTPDHDEYSAVSYGNGEEVFFARTHHITQTTKIMTSRLVNMQWTSPTVVAELSNYQTCEPTSMSADGRRILLKIDGENYIAMRPDLDMNWLQPIKLKVNNIPHLGRMSLLPNGKAVVFEASLKKMSPQRRPVADLYRAHLEKDGSIGTPLKLESLSTSKYNERNPMVGLNGRVLFFSSNDPDGYGRADMYVAHRKSPDNWAKWDTIINLGSSFNSVYDDLGFSFIPDHGGDVLFTKENRCHKDKDIWAIDLPKAIFPDSMLRITGLVVDKDNKPHPGGFMEITLNESRAPIYVPINDNGVYSYAINGGVKIVRLYPSVPGLVTIQDRVYYPDYSKKAGVIRDTFRLFTFEHMRKGYQLKFATFDDNQNRVNNEQIYAELTELHHVAERMGADLQFVGHTDNSGTESLNHNLALERALAVQRYMIDKCGLPEARTSVLSMGAERPKCPNDTPEGQRCNRRVEVLFLLPKSK